MKWLKKKPVDTLLRVDVSDPGDAWTNEDARALRAFLLRSNAGVKLVRILKANVVANALAAGRLDEYAQGVQCGRNVVIGELLGFAIPDNGRDETSEGV